MLAQPCLPVMVQSVQAGAGSALSAQDGTECTVWCWLCLVCPPAGAQLITGFSFARSLSVSLALCLSVPVSLCLSLSLPFSVSLSLCLSVSVSLFLRSVFLIFLPLILTAGC